VSQKGCCINAVLLEAILCYPFSTTNAVQCCYHYFARQNLLNLNGEVLNKVNKAKWIVVHYVKIVRSSAGIFMCIDRSLFNLHVLSNNSDSKIISDFVQIQ
jgi:hypothetical protein